MDGADALLALLRVVHIGGGVFWAGSIAFLTLVLEPRYRRHGTQELRRVLRPLLPIMGPALLGASLATIASGAMMAVIVTDGHLDLYLRSSWGRAMLVGAVAAIGALLVGDGLVRLERRRLDRLGAELADRTLAGDPPGPEAMQRVERLEQRLWALGRANFALVAAAVLAMAVARYI